MFQGFGEIVLQAICGGFDSHEVHARLWNVAFGRLPSHKFKVHFSGIILRWGCVWEGKQINEK